MKKFIFLLATVLTIPLKAWGYDQVAALDYLASHQNSSWSIMALSAMGRSGLETDFLKNSDTSQAIKFEADMLAITALGQDPRSFASVDLVAKLKTFYQSGQIGETNQLNDDVFGGLALLASGVVGSDQVIVDAKNYLLDKQNANGSWGWQIASQDVDTTAGT